MTTQLSKITRGSLPPLERQARSRLLQLLSNGQGLIRGTLSQRTRTCGTPGCKCARGEKHSSLYLVVSLNGKYKQICIPRALEAEVRSWVGQYQRAQELLEELSLLQLEKLLKREK